MNRFALIITVAACLTSLMALNAAAQVPAGGDGRARDANPGVGSGGTNRLEGQIDYNARNNLVTGDVAGGRGLRIDQPYRAPNEFGDRLGSDDLFDFRAHSLPSAPGRLNATQGPINLGGGTSFYRSYSSPPAPSPDQLGTPRYDAGAGDTYGRGDILIADLITPGIDLGIGADRREGAGPLPAGRALQVTSPLLGVPQPGLDPLAPQLQPRRSAGSAFGRDIVDLDPPGYLQVPGWSADPLQQDLRRDSRFEQPLYNPLLLGTDQPEDDDPASLDGQQSPDALTPTTLLGWQMQGRLDSQRPQRLNNSIQQRMDRLGTSLQERAEAQNRADANSPYANLLSAVRGDTPASSSSTPGRQGPDGRAAAIDLGGFDEARTREAEQLRDQALNRAFETRDTPGASRTTGSTETPGTRQRTGAGQTSDQDQDPAEQDGDAVVDLLSRLNYDLPPLQTLAGERQTQINQIMKQAEGELAAGQYFTAERLYRQAVERQPDEPLAQVGLIHAQLGAGMIRSATLNLRNLFEKHPEVIAARYQANLLPEESRLRWVRGELEQSLASGDTDGDAPLLLAYLGYQVDSRQLVRYGLATAEARNPRDPLMPVLRHIWLDQTDNSTEPTQ